MLLISGPSRLQQSGSDGNNGVLRIAQSSSITGTSPSDCLVSYLGHSLGSVLHFCREAVGVFYSPSWLSHSLGVPTSLQRCSRCILQPQPTRLHVGGPTPLQRCSRCILQSQLTEQLVGGVLPLCRDAVGVFYCPSRLSLQIFLRLTDKCLRSLLLVFKQYLFYNLSNLALALYPKDLR